MGIEKTIEIKAIDKEKALKRALNILGVELTENEAVEIIEKVKPRKKFFGLFGTEPGIYEVSIKTKEKEAKEKKTFIPKAEKQEKFGLRNDDGSIRVTGKYNNSGDITENMLRLNYYRRIYIEQKSNIKK